MMGKPVIGPMYPSNEKFSSDPDANHQGDQTVENDQTNFLPVNETEDSSGAYAKIGNVHFVLQGTSPVWEVV
jgi:hypothetical protein